MLSFEKTHENFWNQNKQLKKKKTRLESRWDIEASATVLWGLSPLELLFMLGLSDLWRVVKKKKKKKKKLQDDLREGRFSTLKINILQDFTKKEFSSGVTSRSF